MFNHILVAIQGDEQDNYWSKLFVLLNMIKSNITVLHVKETSLSHYGYVDQLASGITKEQFVSYIYQMAQEREHEIQTKLSQFAKDQGIKFSWQVREGKPSDEIIKELKAGNYDLLILGTKPKSPGNTSSRVKEQALKESLKSLLILD